MPADAALSQRFWRRHLQLIRTSDRELARIILNAAKEAERMAELLVGDPRIGAVARRAQYRMHAAAMRELHAGLWGDISQQIQSSLEESARLGTQSANVLSRLLGGVAGYDDFIFAAQQSADYIVSRTLNDIKLSRRVYNNAAWANGRIDRIINNGIGSGKSAKEIAADVRRFINPKTPGGVRYAAQRLGRTELNNAFHRSSVDMMKQQPWIVEVEWHLSGSHLRADICDTIASDGPYKPKDVPMKPHPQCLCYVVPVVPSRAEFLNNLINGKYDRKAA